MTSENSELEVSHSLSSSFQKCGLCVLLEVFFPPYCFYTPYMLKKQIQSSSDDDNSNNKPFGNINNIFQFLSLFPGSISFCPFFSIFHLVPLSCGGQ